MVQMRSAARVTGGARRSVVSQPAKPNVDHIVIEDDTPVDSMFAEKQQRLSTEPLYSSWRGGKKRRRFVAMANVGLFFNPEEPPLVPDTMLSLDVSQPKDFSKKENNTYFVWTRGKVPDAVLEIVSDRRGGEETTKMRTYAKWGIPYYVIFDPRNVLRHGIVRAFVRIGVEYQPCDPAWLEGIGLGLILWKGAYEGSEATWLRWCDRAGRVIPTGREKAQRERLRAKQAKQRADKEQQRADKEQQRADKEQQRADKLAQQLRKLGADPVE